MSGHEQELNGGERSDIPNATTIQVLALIMIRPCILTLPYRVAVNKHTNGIFVHYLIMLLQIRRVKQPRVRCTGGADMAAGMVFMEVPVKVLSKRLSCFAVGEWTNKISISPLCCFRYTRIHTAGVQVVPAK